MKAPIKMKNKIKKGLSDFDWDVLIGDGLFTKPIQSKEEAELQNMIIKKLKKTNKYESTKKNEEKSQKRFGTCSQMQNNNKIG